MKNDIEIVCLAIKTYGEPVIKYLSKDLMENEMIIEEIWKQVGSYENASELLRRNVKFSKRAISANPESLQFAPINIKNNKEVVLIAVQHRGSLLEFASESLREDVEPVKIKTRTSKGLETS